VADMIRRLSSSTRLRGGLILLSLLLPLIPLLPGLDEFPYPSADTRYSDLTLSHYPNAIFLRRTLLEEHRLPFWSPNILSGSPFAANPLSGMWYPPGWLALLLPLPFGFNLSILLHLLWGGLGMYNLLRAEGLSRQASLLGALSFEAMPKVFAHYGAGHLTLLYAVPWTPWLLWASQSAVIVRGKRFAYLEALFLSLVFLADVRWSIYAGALWVAYSLLQKAREYTFKDRLCNIIRQSLTAAMLAAPLAIPLVEFTRLSSRLQMKPEENLIFSLPASRLLGLFFPDFGGFHEYTLYVGQLVLLLSILAIQWNATCGRVKFWMWAAGLSLFLALGSQIPFMDTLARLPFIDLIRVPSRALFITGLSLSALAARAMDSLLSPTSLPALANSPVPSPTVRRKSRLALAAVVSFILVLSVGVWIVSKGIPINFLWGSAFALVGAAWIDLKLEGRIPDCPWYIFLVGFCLLDWGVVDHSLFASRPPEEVYAEGSALAQHLASIPGEFRIYSPSYSLPQQTAAIFRLQLADGVDPLQLSNYDAFIQSASGVPWSGYSVSVPPYASGNPSQDNTAFRPDPSRLGWLNVRYVVSDFDLPVEGLELEVYFGTTRLYVNRKWMPRAWVQTSEETSRESYQSTEIVRWNSDRIELQASGPGLLVLSEITYPGWQVWVDGEKALVKPVAGLFRGVELEQGVHKVIFSFRPLSVYLGLLVGFFTFSLIVILWIRQRAPEK
jgi:hypothetical protein